MSEANEKKQVSIPIELVKAAKAHPLFVPGRGEGQGYTGIISLALSWALSEENEGALQAYQASFELANLEAEKKALEARIKALSKTAEPATAPKKGKK